MHTSDIYHTQGIKGYHVQKTEYGQDVTVKLYPNGKARESCPVCVLEELCRSCHSESPGFDLKTWLGRVNHNKALRDF